MSTSTKALAAFLFYAFGLPAIIAIGLFYIMGIPFLMTFITLVASSILFEQFVEKGVNAKRLADFTDKYSKLPYKKYIIKLDCQSCGFPNSADVDLDSNTEFVCTRCHRKNAIYTTFTTAIAATHEKL